MALISDLTPLNYQIEKERFLADPTFNPQFQYIRSFTEEELVSKGFPSEPYLSLAEKVVEATFSQYTPAQIQAKRGTPLSQETVSRALRDFLQKHGILERYSIIWSPDFVSRAMVTPTEIRLRLPSSVFENDLAGLIYHEIGTHALRRINNEQQPWSKKRKLFDLRSHIRTEEGLAVIHTLLGSQIHSAYYSALQYLATRIAQSSSFLEVWQFVKQYIENDEFAFAMAFRKKRGLTDSSQPGGFTKDLVYWEGFVDTTQFLLAQNFPIRELYFGKIAFQDLEKAVALNPDFEPLLPHFYTDNPAEYADRVREIAAKNFLL